MTHINKDVFFLKMATKTSPFGNKSNDDLIIEAAFDIINSVPPLPTVGDDGGDPVMARLHNIYRAHVLRDARKQFPGNGAEVAEKYIRNKYNMTDEEFNQRSLNARRRAKQHRKDIKKQAQTNERRISRLDEFESGGESKSGSRDAQADSLALVTGPRSLLDEFESGAESKSGSRDAQADSVAPVTAPGSQLDQFENRNAYSTQPSMYNLLLRRINRSDQNTAGYFQEMVNYMTRRDERKRLENLTSFWDIFEASQLPKSPLYWHRQLYDLFTSGVLREEVSPAHRLKKRFFGGERNFITILSDITHVTVRALIASIRKAIFAPFWVTMYGTETVKEIVLFPIGFGSVDGIKRAFNKIILEITYMGVGIMFTIAEFTTLYLICRLYDATFSTDISKQVGESMDQYVKFLKNCLFDACTLVWRIVFYMTGIWDGGDLDSWEVWGVESDQRLFNIARIVIDFIWNNVSEMADGFWERPGFRQVGEFFSSTGESIGEKLAQLKEIFDWAVELAAQAGVKTKAGVETVYEMGRDGMVVVDEAVTGGRVTGAVSMAVESISGLAAEARDEFFRRFYGKLGYGNALPPPPNVPEFPELPMPTNFRPYNVFTVCSVLGITKSTFDSLQNKKMVKYINENRFNKAEFAIAVYHTDRELKMRKTSKVTCTKNINLRF